MTRNHIGISRNIDIHDRIAQYYDDRHIEIYNPTEQGRIHRALSHAISYINTGSGVPLVLDFGAGTGNITTHLIRLKCSVVAADVSPGSIAILEEKLPNMDRLQTLLLNGEDLSNIGDNTFDMVASYSVLHHVYDYLKIVREFVRVLKPGGILYIDHEACPSYWEDNRCYFDYLGELGDSFRKTHLFELGIPDPEDNFYNNFIYMLKRYMARNEWIKRILYKLNKLHDEGDLHVTKEDHIEWEKIMNTISPYCEIPLMKDYLACREKNEAPILWKKWMDKFVDMRLIIARKIPL